MQSFEKLSIFGVCFQIEELSTGLAGGGGVGGQSFPGSPPILEKGRKEKDDIFIEGLLCARPWALGVILFKPLRVLPGRSGEA